MLQVLLAGGHGIDAACVGHGSGQDLDEINIAGFLIFALL